MNGIPKLSTLSEFLTSSFDFLIVGGGTAGLVLAARLSENPHVSVGLLEAGSSKLGDEKVESLIGMGAMLSNPEYDWAYQTVPQKGHQGKSHHVPKGKMLGGTSGVNYMAYGRPSVEDIDDWAKAMGSKEWSWDDLEPYYRKHEGLELDKVSVKEYRLRNCPVLGEVHGTNGPLHTSLAPWQAPIEQTLLPALDEALKVGRPVDPWSGRHLGFYRSLFNVDRSGDLPKRSYSANAYLAPVLAKRTNLKVLTNALAARVIFSKQGGEETATGAQFYHDGSLHSVTVKQEVILSAGVIESPKLLELSGIGDPDVLAAAGVHCVVPNKHVGENLQEKPLSSVVYELAPGEISIESLPRNPDLLKEHQRLLREEGGGAFAGAISLMGFIPYSSQVSLDDLDSTVTSLLSPRTDPNSFQRRQRHCILSHLVDPKAACIQTVCLPTNCAVGQAYADCSKLAPGPPPGRNPCYSIMFSDMYPASRGSTHIVSKDVRTPPQVDLGLLTHPADVDVLAAAAAFADRVFRSPAVAAKVHERVAPPPEVDLEDRDQAREFIKGRVMSYHHALGTCAMGSVVDERLRVKGVKGLRVVDASVMPMQVSHAIAATVYAVAEKGADLIKDDFKEVFAL